MHLNLDESPLEYISGLATCPKEISTLTPGTTAATSALSLLCTESPVVLAGGKFIVEWLDAFGLLSFRQAICRGDLEKIGCCFDEPLFTVSNQKS